MRKELSEATSRCAEVSEGRIGFLLFSPYPKYPNHVPLYDGAADQGTPESIAEIFADPLLEPQSPQRGQPEARMGALSPLTETSITSIHRPALQELLRTEAGVAEFVVFRKPSASRPAPEEQLDELTRRVDAVVAGIGD